ALRPHVLSATEIQRLLPEDEQTVLLEYALGPERSYAWVVSRRSISSVPLAGRSEIEAAVRALRQDWNRPSANLAFSSSSSSGDAGPSAALRRLSDLVLAPVSEQLTGRRLVVVPDGALHYVPFSALALGGRTLLDRGEVWSIPAASAWTLLHDAPS